MKEYKTVFTNSSDEVVIEKSRFIGYSFHIEDENEAEEIIKSIKKKHYDATHNCYAYILNDDMSVKRYSDDGEPSSTAGMPMLDVLQKENITNTLIIGTRYFGGIKLGTGGLVRAYTKTAKIALDSNKILNKKIFKKIYLVIDYNFVGKVQKYIDNNNILSDAPEFLENVRFFIYSDEDSLQDLKKDILDITSANATFEIKEQLYLDFIDDKWIK